ncbi:MAG: CotH kinase family protein [Verrucomicrobiota bacterium]
MILFVASAGAAPPDAVEIPTESNAFTQKFAITLQPEPGTTVFYTLDGTLPGAENGTPYQQPIEIDRTSWLQVIAIRKNESGPISSAAYVRLSADLARHQSNLPIMIIDTLGQGSIPGKGWNQMGSGLKQVPRRSALWMLFDRTANGKATFKQKPQLVSRIGIRQRGSFSSSWKEKPYSVEAWDAADEDEDVSPLGMPAESDWTLYYPDPGKGKDRPMIYNAFMWKLSSLSGRYAPRFRWVEAFINEDGDLNHKDRRGVYAIVEKVKRGDDRVPFKKLSDDGKTGGWLLSINRMDPEPEKGWPAPNGATRPQFFHTAGPNRRVESRPNQYGRGDDIPRLRRAQLNFENPSGNKINPAQRAAIENWFKDFEDVLYDDSRWLDPEKGYRHYIDATDFVDFFIYNNLAQNFDGLLLSIYPWRSSEDGKLRIGPCWDFNYGSYNQSGPVMKSTMNQAGNLWYGRLFEDPDFFQLYVERWQTLRKESLSDQSLVRVIQSLVDEIGEEQAVAQGISSAKQWKSRVRSMQTWLLARAAWLDQSLPKKPIFSLTEGKVARGSRFFIRSPHGTVYYTLDGSDPLTSERTLNPAARKALAETPVPLLSQKTPARATIPTDGSLGTSWVEPEFDDSSWPEGTTGVGYDRDSTYRSRIGLDLREQMANRATTAYIRIPFTLTIAPDKLTSLQLRMGFDDGFVAYLNGRKVVTENAPADLTWNAASSDKGNDSTGINPSPYDLTAQKNLLRIGPNLLAIHGLNADLESSDFLINPELTGYRLEDRNAIIVNQSRTVTARSFDGRFWSPAETRRFEVRE